MSTEASRKAAYNPVVIGGGIGGLVAAVYLARVFSRVVLLEARERLGGRAETVEFAPGFRGPLLSHYAYALDETMLRELHLSWRGLSFAQRDIDLLALRPEAQHLVLLRKSAFFRGAQARPPAEERGLIAFRKEAFSFARRMRPLWDGRAGDWHGENQDQLLASIVERLRLSSSETEQLEELSRLSAAAYLDRFFESDALKAALSFDISESGLAPHEAGSALMLIWRYAQASAGRQGAVSQLRGGPGALIAALQTVATRKKVELRMGTRVESIVVESGRAVGVVLASGEILAASAVLSSLDERQTLLGLVPASAIGFGAAATMPDYGNVATAQLLLGLSGLPPFAGLHRKDLRARLMIAERPELAAEAKGAAVAGHLPDDLAMEASIPTAEDPKLAAEGQHVISVLLPYVPAAIKGGWSAHRATLLKRALGALEKVAPGLKERVVAHRLFTPDDIAALSDTRPGELRAPWLRLLASPHSRILTPIAGLYLCGRSAEVVSTLSGCAGRLAAKLVLSEPRRRKGGA